MQTYLGAPNALATRQAVAVDKPLARTLRALLFLPCLAVVLAWAYWPTFQNLAQRWGHDPQYSHGFLVPVFALVLLWSGWARTPSLPVQTSWWGVVWLLTALGMRLVAAVFYLDALEGLSILPALGGISLLLGGQSALRWSWAAIAFLAFMVPLPYRIDMALAGPLRQLATAASVYLLQTFGLPAFAEGNVIVLDDLRLGVVDACSGLGMLMTFLALATAVAILIDRPLGDRLVLVASAIPIAVLANITRITATALAHQSWGPGPANAIMHDLAGWLMMPLALGLLWLELRLLKLLLPAGPLAGPVPLRFLATNRREIPLPANLEKR
jgi:exosortase